MQHADESGSLPTIDDEELDELVDDRDPVDVAEEDMHAAYARTMALVEAARTKERVNVMLRRTVADRDARIAELEAQLEAATSPRKRKSA